MHRRRTYIVRETAISAVINIVIGVLFYLALFSGSDPVPLWGRAGLVIDCLPQGFMVGLMSVLPPGLITRARIRKGTIDPSAPSALPGLRAILLRGLAMALASAIGLAALAALLATLSGVTTVPFASGLIAKALAGGLVAIIVTPPALRAILAVRAA